MAGILSKEQIIEQKAIEDALNSIATNVAKVSTAFDLVAANAHKLTTELGGADNLNKLINLTQRAKTVTEQFDNATKENIKMQKQLDAVLARQNTTYQELNRQKILAQQQQNAINKQIRDSTKVVDNHRSSWDRLGRSIMTYATAYLSVQAVIQAGKAIFNQTKELDQLRFSMATVIKSSVELAETQKFLSEVAINYGGDLLTLSERYIKFRAAAMQSNMSAGETQKIFNSVSKAAGTLGLKTDELAGVYLALEQMISKGKVTTEELRRQLGERLPGAFGIMANALGVTIPQLDKLLKKGQVLTTDALPKFAVALEKAYGIESLKKIDTLAAAQGRMSTQFTKLIQSMQMSNSFKSIINSMAELLGFVTAHIVGFGRLIKIVLSSVTAWTVYNTINKLAIPIQKARIILGYEQTTMLTRLTEAELLEVTATKAAVAGTTLWTRAVNALKVAWATNPLGIIITGLTLIGTALYMLYDKTDDATKETKSFADSMSEAKAKSDDLFNSLSKAKKGSYEYKDAMFQINNLYGSYLPNLLTEKDSIEQIAIARGKANEGLRQEMMLKERNRQLEDAVKAKEDVTAGIMSEIQASVGISATNKGIVFNRILDVANMGIIDPEKRKAIVAKLFRGDLDAINEFVTKATFAMEGYKAKVTNINEFFMPKNSKPENRFDVQLLKQAKDLYEQYAGITNADTKKQFEEKNSFLIADGKNLEQWLQKQITIYKQYDDQVLLQNELSSLQNKGSKGDKLTPLGRMQDTHKQELEKAKKDQEDLLGIFEGTEIQKLEIEKENAIKLLDIRQNQIDEELQIVKKGGKSYGDLLTERAKNETAVSIKTNDFNDKIRKAKIKEWKESDKQFEDDVKSANEAFISNQTAISDQKKLDIQVQALSDLKANKDPKNIQKIHDQANLAMIQTDIDMYDTIAKNATSFAEDDIKLKDWALQRKLELTVQYGNAEFDATKRNEDKIREEKKKSLQAVGDIINTGIDFSKGMYDAQASRAQKAFDSETKAAGDNVEAQIIAKRKFEAEDRKIKRRQAIADKLQAIFNIGLNLAIGASELNAIQVVAAVLAMAAVIAKPIPEFFKGTENAPEQFIAGEKGSEAIIKPSGEMILTPDKPTLFSDKSFIGSTILPHDKTQQMLNNYALHGGSQVFVDMSVSNKHLASMDEQMKKSKEERYSDTQGRQFIRRGSVTTQLI